MEFDPVFIGGEPRSGTTLMRVILDSHSAIACGPESHFLRDPKLREYHHHFRDTWHRRATGFGYTKHDMDDMIRDFVRGFFEPYMRKKGKRRWADKTPKTVHELDYVWELFPSAKFIHMIRDGRDVCCSLLEQTWGPKDLAEAAERWVMSIKDGVRWRGDPRYMEVRYEDLVLHTEREARRVFQFIGEPWEPAVLNYHEQEHDRSPAQKQEPTGPSKPVYTDKLERWRRDMTPKQVRECEKIVGPTLRLLGYPLA